MNIGSLTGEITLDDAMSAVLLRIDTMMKQFAQTTSTSMDRVEESMSGSILKGTFLGNLLADLAMKAFSFTKNLVTGSIQAGLRLEQLGVATRFLGEKAGYSAKYIDDLAKEIEASGISGISSRESIQSLLGAHIDLAQATKLSAIAQNMQSISGKSSSDVFQIMTRALATGNTELLRGIGFQNISLETLKAQNKEQTGYKGVLSGTARTQLIMNAILAEGSEKMGLYGESMKTAGKQASSAERAWDQVSERIGLVLLPVTSTAVKAWYALGQAVRDSVTTASEGMKSPVELIAGWLQSLIEKTGEWASATVTGSIKIFNAYQNLPETFRTVAETAGVATAAIILLEKTVVALAATRFVGWAVAAAKGLGELGAMTAAFGWEGFGVTLSGWGTAVSAALGPIGWLTAALVALATATTLVVKEGGANGGLEFVWGVLTNPAAALNVWETTRAMKALREEEARRLKQSLIDNPTTGMNQYQTREQAKEAALRPPPTKPVGPTVVKVDEIQKLADSLKGAALQKQVDDLTAALLRLDPAELAAARSSGRLADALKPLIAAGADLKGFAKDEADRLAQLDKGWKAIIEVIQTNIDIKKLNEEWDIASAEASQERLKVEADGRQTMNDRIASMNKTRARETDSAYRREMNAIDDWLEEQLKVTNLSKADYKTWSDRVTQEAARARKALAEASWGGASMGSGMGALLNLPSVVNTIKTYGKQSGSGFVTAFSNSISGIGATVVRALEGGGNVWKAVLGQIGNDLGASLSAAFVKEAGAGIGKVGSLVAGLGPVYAAVFASIANAFADMGKSLLDSWQRLSNGVDTAPIEAKFQALKARGQELVDIYLAVRQALLDMGTALSATDLEGIMDNVAQFQTKAELEAIAERWRVTYAQMLASGLYTAETLADAWKKYQDALARAGGGLVAAGGSSSAVDEIVAGFPTRAQLEQAASNAEAAYLRIKNSGLYTAAQVERAFIAWQDALVAAGDEGTVAIRKIDDEMKGLLASIEDEAPEEVMGVIEEAARARLDALQKERDALTQAGIEDTMTAEEEAAAAAATAADKAFEDAKTRADQLDKYLFNLFKDGYTIPLTFTGVPGGSGGGSGSTTPPQGAYTGGYVTSAGLYMSQGGRVPSFKPKGTDTVPAMLTPGEQVLSVGQAERYRRGGGKGGTVVVEISGREWARMMVPEFAEEVRRQRLGGR